MTFSEFEAEVEMESNNPKRLLDSLFTLIESHSNLEARVILRKYLKALVDYVDAKISLHRLRKRLFYDNNYYGYDKRNRKIDIYSSKLNTLRRTKNQLKKEILGEVPVIHYPQTKNFLDF